MFVEQSWIDANNIHKWSIQFNRLDEEQNAWVPFPTKRIATPAGQAGLRQGRVDTARFGQGPQAAMDRPRENHPQ